MKSPRDLKLLKRFGAHLQKLRKEKEFSIRGLADEADIDFSYIIQLEKGDKNPSFLMLHKLADALRISIHELVDIK
ncbi:MAG: helix-turn-helix transcriptional regulator [Chitinophagaceae bacterium]|nr:helix-turn-helix transcriptional regulator [Chitinophagaceae bacterium]